MMFCSFSEMYLLPLFKEQSHWKLVKGGNTDCLQTNAVGRRLQCKPSSTPTKTVITEVFKGKTGERDYWGVRKGKQKWIRGILWRNGQLQKGISGELSEMIWQCGLEERTFCDLVAFHFLKQRISMGTGVLLETWPSAGDSQVKFSQVS